MCIANFTDADPKCWDVLAANFMARTKAAATGLSTQDSGRRTPEGVPSRKAEKATRSVDNRRRTPTMWLTDLSAHLVAHARRTRHTHSRDACIPGFPGHWSNICDPKLSYAWKIVLFIWIIINEVVFSFIKVCMPFMKVIIWYSVLVRYAISCSKIQQSFSVSHITRRIPFTVLCCSCLRLRSSH